jgi:hypothetical protein
MASERTATKVYMGGSRLSLNSIQQVGNLAFELSLLLHKRNMRHPHWISKSNIQVDLFSKASEYFGQSIRDI